MSVNRASCRSARPWSKNARTLPKSKMMVRIMKRDSPQRLGADESHGEDWSMALVPDVSLGTHGCEPPVRERYPAGERPRSPCRWREPEVRGLAFPTRGRERGEVS